VVQGNVRLFVLGTAARNVLGDERNLSEPAIRLSKAGVHVQVRG
jgi:hypothetical protein